jgi:Histone methylation protein DOT1
MTSRVISPSVTSNYRLQRYLACSDTGNANHIAANERGCMKPSNATEALLWRITWTKAFPVVAQTLWSLSAEEETREPVVNGYIEEEDEDDSVWYFIAFHCLWNEAMKRSKVNVENKWKGLLPISSTYCLEPSVRTQPWSNSLGYGEITEGAIFEMAHHIRGLQSNGIGCPNIQTVMDLGSGSGRVVLAAAVALSAQTVIGLEIVPAWHDFAAQLLHPIWNEECMLCGREDATRIDLRCCDFTVDTEWWVHQVDLIFVHGTVFEDALFEEVISICKEAKVGTWIVSISRPLVSSAPRHLHGLEYQSEWTVEMSWGRGIAFVYVVALKHTEQ